MVLSLFLFGFTSIRLWQGNSRQNRYAGFFAYGYSHSNLTDDRHTNTYLIAYTDHPGIDAGL